MDFGANMEVDDDLQALLAEQRRELTAAQAEESDLNLAFQLQMQEAVNASLSANPDVSLPSSSSPTVSEADTVPISSLLAEEISYYEQQILDREAAAAEMKKIQTDLNRRIHDHAFARELQNVPEEQWRKDGDNIEKPYHEGTALGRGVGLNQEDSFRVHVKGLIREEEVKGSENRVWLAGIGVAVCDMNDQLVLEVSKGIAGGEISVEAVEVKAVIEGLNVAIMLGLKRIVIVSTSNVTYQSITGKNRPAQSNLAALFDQVHVISRKLNYCGALLVDGKDLKFSLKLAQDALGCQARQALRNNCGKNVVEACAICLENISVDQMFHIGSCWHRYCFSCMRTYVQIKLLHSKVPKCPHEGCHSELKLDDCKKFLTSELYDAMSQCIMEASIDPAEKIYCPHPTCSALMSKSGSQVPSSHGAQASVRECTKCHRHFCVNCKVPWHDNMTCSTYKQLNPFPIPEDAKLKSLATKSRWRQCPKCNHMVSLGEGCNHIYCCLFQLECARGMKIQFGCKCETPFKRCGHEFCYVCGAKWQNKKATCGCALWDERKIIYQGPNTQQRRT